MSAKRTRNAPRQPAGSSSRPLPERSATPGNAELLESLDLHEHYSRPGHQAFGNGAGTGGKTDGTLTDMGPKPRPRNAPRAAPPWGAEPADLGPRTRNGGGGMADFSRFSRPTQAFGNGAGTGQKGVFTTIGKK